MAGYLLRMVVMPPLSPTGAAFSDSAESLICTRYSGELEEIAKLDRVYYRNPSPTLAERAKYHKRQAELEQIRHRLYAELDAVRQVSVDTFQISVTDHALQKTIASLPRCLLRHEINNYLGVVIGRCELLAELVPSESAEAKHATIALTMAWKIAARLRSDSCPVASNRQILPTPLQP